MILIADGGSTKCDWSGYDVDSKKEIFSIQTRGMNPSYLTKEEINQELEKHQKLRVIGQKVEELYFFGSGCGNVLYQQKMKEIFKGYFGYIAEVVVLGDIEGAVFACTDEPGVVAILGTGSNICYFDGIQIDPRIPSLGYTLMDQGSGNYMGRELLKAYYFNRLSKDVKLLLDQEFDLDVDLVKQKLYSGGTPSAYLASFASFIIENNHLPPFSNIIKRSLEAFFDLSVNQFKSELSEVPLHFVGSIAHFTGDYLREICLERGFTLGKIVKSPISEILHNLEAVKAYRS